MDLTLPPDSIIKIAASEARRYGRTPDQRDDLQSLAVLAVYERAGTVNSATNPAGMARVIARHAILDDLKRVRPLPLKDQPSRTTYSRDPSEWLPDVLDKRSRLATATPAQVRAARSYVNGSPTHADSVALHRLRSTSGRTSGRAA